MSHTVLRWSVRRRCLCWSAVPVSFDSTSAKISPASSLCNKETLTPGIFMASVWTPVAAPTTVLGSSIPVEKGIMEPSEAHVKVSACWDDGNPQILARLEIRHSAQSMHICWRITRSSGPGSMLSMQSQLCMASNIFFQFKCTAANQDLLKVGGISWRTIFPNVSTVHFPASISFLIPLSWRDRRVVPLTIAGMCGQLWLQEWTMWDSDTSLLVKYDWSVFLNERSNFLSTWCAVSHADEMDWSSLEKSFWRPLLSSR